MAQLTDEETSSYFDLDLCSLMEIFLSADSESYGMIGDVKVKEKNRQEVITEMERIRALLSQD